MTGRQPMLPARVWKQWLLLAAVVVAGLLVYSGWTAA